jgi:hypothetical protein
MLATPCAAFTIRDRAAKAIGDKRADVAETGFNKPYSKIIIAKSGLAD